MNIFSQTRKPVSGGLRGRRLVAALAGFFLGSTLLGPVWASDTEVYSRSVMLSGANAPSLFMVLDTSDNMLNCLTSTSSCAPSTGNFSQSRVAALETVMNYALFGNHDSTGNVPITKPVPGSVRMGYARFLTGNNSGAWVRYPADKSLDTLTTLAGTIATDSSVTTSPGDATVDSLGNTTTTATTFTLGNSSPDVAMQFTSVMVPQGATINSVQLSFYQVGKGNTPSISIASEATDNAADFSASNVLARVPASSAFVSDGNYNSNTSPGTILETNGALVKAIQNVVNRSGWCGGNALSLWIRSGNSNKTVTVDSYDGGVAPSLTITYTLPSTVSSTCMAVTAVKAVNNAMDDVQFPENGSSGSQVSYSDASLTPAAIIGGVRNMVGVRFSGLNIPSGATVMDAWLYMTGYQQTGVTGPSGVTINVDAFDQPNLPAFCTTSGCTYPSQTSMTTPTVPAGTMTMPTSIPGGSGSPPPNYAVNVKDMVQQVVKDAGGTTVGALGFRLYNSSTTGSSSVVGMAAEDAGPSLSMVLKVTYQMQISNISTAQTVRQSLLDDLTSFLTASVGGMASIGNTYAEAADYMAGEKVFTTSTATVNGVSYPQPDPRTVIPNSSPVQYQSPVPLSGDCSASYMYMMTDGQANDASQITNHIAPLLPSPLVCDTKLSAQSGNNQLNYGCMIPLAQALAKGTVVGSVTQKSVRTNTVYFGPPISASDPLTTDLTNMADNGAGRYYPASDVASLLASFEATLSALIDVSGTITSPGVAVNQFANFQDLNQLYFAVFDPEALHAHWGGNMKRYQLSSTSTGGVQITDVNNLNAIDPVTTFFRTTAQSWWSPTVDGNQVVLGGAASVLPAPSSRTIWTNLTNATQLENLAGVNGNNGINGSTTQTISNYLGLTGASPANQFTNMVNWIEGYNINIIDPNNPAAISSTLVSTTGAPLRYRLGGVLHSQPVLINYGYFGSSPTAAATDPTLQDNTVYFSDMEGILHAINTSTGVEQFAFFPRETMQAEQTFITDPSQLYPNFGLDLTWTRFRNDANNDSKITTGGSGDQVLLFGGMRMGGKNYYALDVTDRTAPKLLWQITAGNNTSQGNFTNLGQTWSQPVIGNIRINGVVKRVLFIGGGYDPKHETAGYVSPTNDSDTYGNQLYIVDMQTGNVLWWASSSATTASSSTTSSLNVPAMKWSIPGKVAIFDNNNDGLVDAVYFGDLGGQIFRVDLNEANTSLGGLVVRAQLLASLGQTSTTTPTTTVQRRFYETPAVAPVWDPSTNQGYVAVAIGSGYRSHPLDTGTQDEFFLLRDNDELNAGLTSPTYNLQPTLTPSSLQTVDLTTNTPLTSSGNWQIVFSNTGEKVLSSAIIFLNQVQFTTYIPSASTNAACMPTIGSSNFWSLNVGNATATQDLNHIGSITAADRFTSGIVQGLGGSPEVVILPNGNGTVSNTTLIGTMGSSNGTMNAPHTTKIRWYEKTK